MEDVCAGCGLCASIDENIEMHYNIDGYLRPNFNPDHISENTLKLIEHSCPGVVVKNDLKYDVSGKIDKVWGPYNNIYKGYSSERTVRHNGSSGGVLTSIAIFLIEYKKVDCIVHVGASTEIPYVNQTKLSFTKRDIIMNTGSRYAPSSPLEAIKKIVKSNLKCAIIAKPCDISAIRRYLNIKPDLTSNIKYLLSFMCAGIPSIEGTKEVISKFGLTLDEVMELRYRGEGWPGFFKVVENNGKIHKMTYNESWGTILNKHIQFRCKICVDGTGEFADVTCADAWEESNDGYPSFEENEGMSLIIERTSTGTNLINEAIFEGYINIKEGMELRAIDKIQPFQLNRKKNIFPRKLALKLLGKRLPNYNLAQLYKLSLSQNPKQFIKNFAGMFIRRLKLKGTNV